jgi:hypothetical protein
MGNTLGTTNANVIAQKALDTLVARLPLIGKITTNFSNEVVRWGEAVITHIVTAAEASDFDTTNGYVASDRTQVDVSTTLNKHKHHTYSIGVQEATSSRISLIERFAKTSAYAVGAAMVNDLCALVTAGNYSNKTVQALGAGGDGFQRKHLVRCGIALNKRNVLPMDRFMVLNPDYYGSLEMDLTTLSVLRDVGAQVVQSGTLPVIHGFSIEEYSNVPSTGDLVGFAGTADSMCIVSRIPDDPGEGQSNVRLSVVTEPQTGLSMQVREWYEPGKAKFNRTYTLMYGVAVGQATSLQRITSK